MPRRSAPSVGVLLMLVVINQSLTTGVGMNLFKTVVVCVAVVAICGCDRSQPAPNALPTEPFSLYHERIPQERPSCFWCLQSGATATVRTLSVGRLLFHGLKEHGLMPICSTSNDESDVVLHEGFVAGDYKVLQDGNSHANDAVLMAIAFHYSCDADLAAYSTLHSPGEFAGDVLSHWSTIVADSALTSMHCKTDCCIVGFDRNNEALRNACAFQ